MVLCENLNETFEQFQMIADVFHGVFKCLQTLFVVFKPISRFLSTHSFLSLKTSSNPLVLSFSSIDLLFFYLLLF